ncbi:sirohydrochlorin chelatase [Streptomyces mashuensis]|uniref:Sirohydrochlorin chelatase n=1 Tax=Streptomyces mashuensis TaxID=33904 RepID=A0A919AU29_9ACTN|nr:sirohydrochlorin chelatase [Streptomyces mashuensis]GHF25436.1 sirohydrochlorin chelatase [Streptomyces mashuensis]
MTPPPLVLLAHGSRDPRHAATVQALRAGVAGRRPGLRAEVAFLDFNAPRVSAALGALAASGEREAVVLPLLLTRAFHAKTDVPAALRAAAARLPRLTIRTAGVLGPSPLLRAALERRLTEAGVHDRASTAVVLAAAGSSDPEATAEVERLAREWQRAGGWWAVRPAYASARGPRPAEAVTALRTAGAPRVAVAPFALAPGRLPARIAAGSAEADTVADVLGAAPELAELVLRRYDEAVVAGRRLKGQARQKPSLAGV